MSTLSIALLLFVVFICVAVHEVECRHECYDFHVQLGIKGYRREAKRKKCEAHHCISRQVTVTSVDGTAHRFVAGNCTDESTCKEYSSCLTGNDAMRRNKDFGNSLLAHSANIYGGKMKFDIACCCSNEKCNTIANLETKLKHLSPEATSASTTIAGSVTTACLALIGVFICLLFSY